MNRIVQFHTSRFCSVVRVPGVPLAVNKVRDRYRLCRWFLCRRLYRRIRWFTGWRFGSSITTITNHFRACSEATKRRIGDSAGSTAEFLAGSGAFVGHRKHRIIQVGTRLASSQSAWPGADIFALDRRGAASIGTHRLDKILRSRNEQYQG